LFTGSVDPAGRFAELIPPIGSGFIILDSNIVNLGTGSADTATWVVRTPADLQEMIEGTGEKQPVIENLLAQNYDLLFRVTVTEANSGQLISRDTIHTVNVEDEALLNLAADIIAPDGAIDRIVSTYQQFEVNVRIDNLGGAATIDSSIVRISLPTAFSFNNTSLDTQEVVSLFEGEDTTLIVYTDSIPHGPLTLRSKITEPADDINKSANATLQDSIANIQNVRTVTRADLALSTQIAPPSTVAQGEIVEISTIVRKFGTAAITRDSVWSRLEITGNGLTLSGPATRGQVLGDTILWRLRSTTQTSQNSVTITIDTTQLVQDENNDYQGEFAFISDSSEQHIINVVNQTPVVINSAYLTSAIEDSTQDITVSSDQENIFLTVFASFNPVYSEGRTARLRLPAGISLTDSSVIAFTPGVDSVEFRLTAPPFPRNRFPIDVIVEATSSSSGNLEDDTVTVYMTVLSKGVLSLNAEITSPTGARDSTVSYGQEFRIKTYIFNSGAASTITDYGTVRLTTGDSLWVWDGQTFVSEVSQRYILSDRRAEIEWRILASENSQVTSLITKIGDLKAEKQIILDQQAQTALEDGGYGGQASVERIDAEINELGGQIEMIMTSSELFAILDTIPDDVYTGLPAAVDSAQNSATIDIEILPAPIFNVSSLAAYNVETGDSITTLSTNQTFKYIAVIDTSDQVSSTRLARLDFPEPFKDQINGFRFPEFGTEKLFEGDSVSWEIVAPDTSPEIVGLTPVPNIIITIRSFDNNTGNEIFSKDTVTLQIERQAVVGLELEIIDPPSARDQRLAKEQEFTLEARIRKSGDANLSGNGSLELLLTPQDSIEYLSVTPIDSTLLDENSTIRWRLRTPNRFITSTIRARFVNRFNDENTGAEAALDPLNAVGNISISTEEKTIEAMKVPGIEPQNILRGGDRNVPLIGLRISNEEAIDVDNVFIDSLQVTMIDNNGLQTNTSLASMFNRIQVINYSYYIQNFSKVANEPDSLADTTFVGNEGPVVTIRFNRKPLQLLPGQVDTLVILADLKNVSSSTSFNFKVLDIFAYVGDVGSKVTVVDENGTNFRESDQGTSTIISLLSESPEDQFFNYPNPFGQNGEITRFVFFLEQSGPVEIRIYNLMGGLVRTLKEDNIDANGGRVVDGIGQLTWDGYNDAGNRVLNGVYLAVLRANGKTYKTKVAYIK
jgi:hypothetical protein